MTNSENIEGYMLMCTTSPGKRKKKAALFWTILYISLIIHAEKHKKKMEGNSESRSN